MQVYKEHRYKGICPYILPTKLEKNQMLFTPLINFLLSLFSAASINSTAPAIQNSNILVNKPLENKVQIENSHLKKPLNKIQNFAEKKYETGNKQGESFYVLVNSDIYDSLGTSISQHANDVARDENYNVSVFSALFNSPDSLKGFFQQGYENDDLIGAFLVGNFPYKFFQGMTYDGEYQQPPCETFLKDMDGTWLDTLRYDPGTETLVPGTDSIPDTHIHGTGSREVEIFLGRLEGNLPWGPKTETEVLQDYFARNHLYRENNSAESDTVMLYFDDDLAHRVDIALSGIQQAYNNIVVISDSNETTADDYREKLTRKMAWMIPAAHSWPRGHRFDKNNGTEHDYFWSYEVPNIGHEVPYFLVYGCNAGEFTEDNFILGFYVLYGGLGGIGYTARAPSPNEWEQFWLEIGSEGNLGEALNEHVNYWINRLDPPQPNVWNNDGYSMDLIGDPTLRPRKLYGVEIADNPVKNLEYKIVPNPVVGKQFSIKFNDSNYMPESEGISIGIYDVKGSLVKKELYNGDGKIDTEDLASGVYFVRLVDENGKDIGSKVQKAIIVAN